MFNEAFSKNGVSLLFSKLICNDCWHSVN